MRELVRKVVAVCAALCLAVAYVPGLSYAAELVPQDVEEGTVSCGNGWVLAYEAEDGVATVTGVDTAGSGTLAIPSSIALSGGGSATVTALGASAFRDCTELTTVELPDTLVTMGNDALRGTGLTSITIPASVAYLPVRCFWECTSLVSIDFEGTLEFVGYRAFSGCSALVELRIPALKGDEYSSVRYTTSNSTSSSVRMGTNSLKGCSSLVAVIFEAGGEGTYFENNYGSLASDISSATYLIINYMKLGSSRGAGQELWDSNSYFAMRYYESEEACEADEDGSDALYTAVYQYGANLYDAIYEADEVASQYLEAYSSGSMPSLEDGMVWGVSDSMLGDWTSELNDTVDLYPVERENLDYGWVSSPEIEAAGGAAASSDNNGGESTATSNASTVNLNSAGIPDLSGMAVYAGDGSLIDEDLYELHYLHATQDDGGHSEGYVGEVYAGEVWEEGTYQVYADGLDGTASEGTSTGDASDTSPTGKSGVSFTVAYYIISVNTFFSGTDRSLTLGRLALYTDSAIAGTPAFSVVASADNWQDCLVASGLAAVGGGLAVFTEGEDTDDYAYSALMGSDKIYVVGGEDAVGSTVMSRITTEMNKTSSDITVEILGSSVANDPDALALAVFKGINNIADTYGYEWGSTAIVASSTQQLASSSVASYAYQGSCPVLLTADDGSLSESAIEQLEQAGIEQVMVAGPESYVPASTVATLQAAGFEVQRIAAGSSAYESSLEVRSACSEDGITSASGDAIVAASALDTARCVAAAEYAAAIGAEFVAVSSSADVKALVALALEEEASSVRLAGDYTDIDAALEASIGAGSYELLSSMWDDTYSTDIAVGDTIERGGVLYEVTGAGSVSCASFLEERLEALEWGTFSYDGTSYDPGDIPAAQFACNSWLKSVSIAASASVGEGAFEGCTALTSVTVRSSSVGASAFAGCTALTSAKLTSTALKTIPASCFAGCTKLASVSIASTALTSVGKRAFDGCKKLKSVSLKSTKLTSIGAFAFEGCSAMTKATVSSKKLKTVGASAFSGCSKLATVTIASTALTSLGAKAFYGCKKLKSLNLKSAKLKTIGASAFQGCSAMTKLTVSSTALTKVGAKALYGCKKLKTLTLKTKKLKTVGKNALKGTTKSLTVKVPKAKVKKYKKLLQKKGLNKKAKVKAA